MFYRPSVSVSESGIRAISSRIIHRLSDTRSDIKKFAAMEKNILMAIVALTL
jgi:hypothetical protein